MLAGKQIQLISSSEQEFLAVGRDIIWISVFLASAVPSKDC